MPDYVSLPIVTDPRELTDEAYAKLQAIFPGWDPADGGFASWLLEAGGDMSAVVRDLSSDVPPIIFQYFGASLMQIAPLPAAAATGDTTWTMKDNAGYTIPAGTEVGIAAAGDDLVGFEVLVDVVVPPGSTVTAAGEVTIIAKVQGADGSGLSGTPVGKVEPIDALEFVDHIALVGSTSGGADAEDEDVYMNRLASLLSLLTPRPVLARDAAVIAKTIPGVARAVALDNYNPTDHTFNNEKMVGVAAIDTAGADVNSTIKGQIDALLQGERETNFIFNIFSPTYTAIDVTFTANALPGVDPASAEAAAEAAVAEYLSAANWGLPPGGTATGGGWVNQPKVRYLEVSQVINEVSTIDYIGNLSVKDATINNRGAWSASNTYAINDVASNGGSWYRCIAARSATATVPSADPTHWVLVPGDPTSGFSDVLLHGDVPLPTAGAIAGTVS